MRELIDFAAKWDPLPIHIDKTFAERHGGFVEASKRGIEGGRTIYVAADFIRAIADDARSEPPADPQSIVRTHASLYD